MENPDLKYLYNAEDNSIIYEPKEDISVSIYNRPFTPQNVHESIYKRTFIQLIPNLLYKKSICEKLCCTKLSALQILEKIEYKDINTKEREIILNHFQENHNNLPQQSLIRSSIIDLYLLAAVYDYIGLRVYLDSDLNFIDTILRLVRSSFSIFESYFSHHPNESPAQAFFIQIHDFIVGEFRKPERNFTSENLEQYLNLG